MEENIKKYDEFGSEMANDLEKLISEGKTLKVQYDGESKKWEVMIV